MSSIDWTNKNAAYDEKRNFEKTQVLPCFLKVTEMVHFRSRPFTGVVFRAGFDLPAAL